MNTPIFILERTPGAEQTVPWTAICHTPGAFIVISYEEHANDGRWLYRSLQRRFTVRVYHAFRGRPLYSYSTSRCATLTTAMRKAQQLAWEQVP